MTAQGAHPTDAALTIVQSESCSRPYFRREGVSPAGSASHGL